MSDKPPNNPKWNTIFRNVPIAPSIKSDFHKINCLTSLQDLGREPLTRFLEMTGLDRINEVITRELSGISESFYLEYSFLGGMLDVSTNSRNKVTSYLYAEGSDYLCVNNIKEYFSEIIRCHKKDCNNTTLYEHPYSFLFPEEERISYTVGDRDSLKDKSVRNIKKVAAANVPKDTSTVDKKEDLIEIKENILYGRTRFKRSFEYTQKIAIDIINKALENNDGNDSIGSLWNNMMENLHAYYHHNFINLNKRSDIKTVFMFLPISGSAASNLISDKLKPKQNQGVIFLFFVLDKLEEDADENKITKAINHFAQSIYQKVGDISRYSSYNFLYNIGAFLYRDAKQQTIRSAIGSIMSRNGSHNIGSHVLSSLTHHIGTMPDDRVLYQYIQQRMDYIANVTTDFPSWTTPTMLVGDMMKVFLSQHHLLEYISESEGLHAYCFQDPNTKESVCKEQEKKIRIHVRRLERNGKDLKKNTHFFSYRNEDPSRPIQWDKDIALAIPGGIVGQQAFFTILENVIRNAAKHGWASSPAENLSVEKPGNLDIFVCLETPENNDDAIVITVWDNMSDVFQPFLQDHDKIKKLAQVLAPGNKDGTNENGESGISFDDIDKKTKRFLTNEEINAITAYEDYKSFIPLHLQQQILLKRPLINDMGVLRRESWGLAEMKISAGFLWKYEIDEIGGLKELDDPNDYIIHSIAVNGIYSCPDNTSSDMECSKSDCKYHNDPSQCPTIRKKRFHLGYRFKIHKPRELLIVLNPNDLKDEAKKAIERYSKVFKKNGIFFAEKKDQDKKLYRYPEEPDPDSSGLKYYFKGFNFDYIVFPDYFVANSFFPASNGSIPTDDLSEDAWSHFPFRCVFGEDTVIGLLEGLYTSLNIEDEEYEETEEDRQEDLENTICSIKNAVYKVWLEQLKKQRGYTDQIREDVALTMMLETETKEGQNTSGSGEGLFTDYNLLQYVFHNLYHDVVSEGMADKSNVGIVREMIALYPDPCGIIRNKEELTEGYEDEIEIIVKDICTMVQNAYPYLKQRVSPGKTDFDGDESEFWENHQDFVRSYYKLLEKETEIMQFIKRTSPDDFNQIIAKFSFGEVPGTDDMLDEINMDSDDDDSMMEELNEEDNPDDSQAVPLGSVLAKELYTAYRNCDILFRRLEDRIVTLPPEYSSDKNSGKKCKPDSRLLLDAGIALIEKNEENTDAKTDGTEVGKEVGEKEQVPLIKYCRHDKERKDSMIYAEALSGSQSCLSQLHRITHDFRKDDIGMFVRLAENALMRIIIIDERVSKFLKEHEHMKKVYKAMNIDVVEITSAKPKAVKEKEKEKEGKGTPTIKLTELTLHEGKNDSNQKWDILIIHQGIIDKWFSDHSKKNSGNLIHNLRVQEKIPYVVITTGRGRPDNVPEKAKILPFSTVESTLFCEYPEKMLLVGTVMNILPSKEKK